MNNSMKALLYAIKNGRDLDCKILDYEPARELCRIYRFEFEEQSHDLYHFLAFVRERYGGHLVYVLEQSIVEFDSNMSEEEFKGITQHLVSLRKQRLVADFLMHYGSISDLNVSRVLNDMRGIIEEIESMRGVDDTSHIGEILDSVLKNIEEKSLNPGIPGISTGFSNLDEVLGGYIPGSLIYVGGRPGQGKSAFAINSALRVAEKYPVLIVSREMTAEQLGIRMASILSEVPIAKMQFGSGLTNEDKDRIKQAASYLRTLPIYFDEDMGRPFYAILDNIKKKVKEDGVKVVFIDYIQLLAERSADSTHELGRISRKLKLLAVDNNVTIVALSQLNREVEKREDKRPRPSDLRQSGNMEEDGDVVMFIYRDEVYNSNSPLAGKMEIIVTKNRPLGRVGTVMLEFDQFIYKLSEAFDGQQ